MNDFESLRQTIEVALYTLEHAHEIQMGMELTARGLWLLLKKQQEGWRKKNGLRNDDQLRVILRGSTAVDVDLPVDRGKVAPGEDRPDRGGVVEGDDPPSL